MRSTAVLSLQTAMVECMCSEGAHLRDLRKGLIGCIKVPAHDQRLVLNEGKQQGVSHHAEFLQSIPTIKHTAAGGRMHSLSPAL